jgi:hypothetical protein
VSEVAPEELIVVPLAVAAERLQIDPFEFMRLLVMMGEVPATLQISEALIDRVRAAAGIELWWAEDVRLPTDASPSRAIVRAALRQLLERGFVGARATRIDNLWRGRPEDEALLRRAVSLLHREGMVGMSRSRAGVVVSVSPAAVPQLDAAVRGESMPAALAALA